MQNMHQIESRRIYYECNRSGRYWSEYQYDTSTKKTSQTNASYGNTVGDPKLSDKAAKYYEQLKKKYSDMDFVLVSNDSVDGAEQKAAKFANRSEERR